MAARDEMERGEISGLVEELLGLEREEQDISALRRQLHARLASFPNEVTERRERQISKYRRELHPSDRLAESRACVAGLAGQQERLTCEIIEVVRAGASTIGSTRVAPYPST